MSSIIYMRILYWKLRAEDGLDLSYFLVERQVTPFVKVIQIKQTNPILFNEINDNFYLGSGAKNKIIELLFLLVI
ncbi:hypothetical protein [Enterobacillus tribolii]|uniref:Uncharacterized protein n=1 Tax=Enterobacillus tribolii TaxID=1487935 RepID=A0A370QPN6_9GAMM|nr:hypothetical protein [Enterobacillus tribolii]MBW7982020.1 hypothetical protein [Enterobacillus tribolii]RDK89960.1 hypothetical protein C8D90_106166 [Enterobacillus tribolii]